MNLLLKDKSVGRSKNTRGGGKSVIESHLMKQGLLLFMQKSRWGAIALLPPVSDGPRMSHALDCRDLLHMYGAREQSKHH